MIMLKNKFLKVSILGLGHGVNDMIAGFFLGSFVQFNVDELQIGMYLVLYNLLAFGGQYPAALLIEKLGQHKKFLQGAYGLNIIAVAIFAFLPQFSIVLAGIASAFYHVAGGALSAEKNKAMNIGLFAAPGVAGLIAGGWLAYSKIEMNSWLLIIAIFFAMILFILPLAKTMEKKQLSNKQNDFIDGHDVIMILLLVFISFRSVIWNVFQLIHEQQYDWLLIIAAAAFAGKIAGGWIADRIGWRTYSFISLTLAVPLLTLFKKELVLFSIGIGLLQSGIPASTALLIKAMNNKTEKAIGLSFGLAIILSGMFFYTPIREIFLSDVAIWIMALMMAAALFISMKVKTNDIH